MWCVKELALELEDVINKIEKAYDDIKNEKSRLDLLREDLLHFIEGSTFNASQGYKYAKALQKIQNERRIVSDNFKSIQILYDRINIIKDKINKATLQTINIVNKNEKIAELGLNAYSPRILRNINKEDILSQVIDILNEEE